MMQPTSVKPAVPELAEVKPDASPTDAGDKYKIAAKVRKDGVKSLSSEEIKVILSEVMLGGIKCLFVFVRRVRCVACDS